LTDIGIFEIPRFSRWELIEPSILLICLSGVLPKELPRPCFLVYDAPSMTNSITLPSACDFHLHLRQGDMMRMVTPKVQEGGVSLAYIMVIIKHF
jgi:hypothetical protein